MGWIRVITPLSHALIPTEEIPICIIDEIYQHRIFHRDKYIMSCDAQLKASSPRFIIPRPIKKRETERTFRSVL